MAFDPVPWFVGGGAEHSPEVARLIGYVATAGADGVTAPGDMKVQPLAVPGGSVRVMKGACLMPARAAGADQQSYAARNLSEEVVAIAPTGSGAGRIDMVIVRVEDSTVAGEPWPAPPSAEDGPYVFARVLEGVPGSAVATNQAARAYLRSQGYTGVPLAAVTLPASTGTITGAMISDLRNLARPRSERAADSPSTSYGIFLSATSDTVWPGAGYAVDVPEWATHATISVTLSGLWVATAYPAFGFLSAVVPSHPTIRTPDVRFNAESAPPTIVIAGSLPGISAVAGQRVTFQVQGRKTAASPGMLQTADETAILYDIQFYERPL